MGFRFPFAQRKRTPAVVAPPQPPARKFLWFEDEELHIIYDGLIAHGGDAADESMMEELEDEFSYRGIRRSDRCR